MPKNILAAIVILVALLAVPNIALAANQQLAIQTGPGGERSPANNCYRYVSAYSVSDQKIRTSSAVSCPRSSSYFIQTVVYKCGAFSPGSTCLFEEVSTRTCSVSRRGAVVRCNGVTDSLDGGITYIARMGYTAYDSDGHPTASGGITSWKVYIPNPPPPPDDEDS